MRPVFDVCWPSTRTVVRTFRTLKAARAFTSTLTLDEVKVLLVRPQDFPPCRHFAPIIARRDRARA